jgi:hypothetical protein
VVAVDPGEPRRIVRPELLRRQRLAAILVERAEPDGGIPRQLTLTDVAVTVGIGGIERETLGHVGRDGRIDLCYRQTAHTERHREQGA